MNWNHFEKDYKKWNKRITKEKLDVLDFVESVFRLKGTLRVLYLLDQSKNQRSRRLRLIDFHNVTKLPQSVLKKSIDYLVTMNMIDMKNTDVTSPRVENILTYEITDRGMNLLDALSITGRRSSLRKLKNVWKP